MFVYVGGLYFPFIVYLELKSCLCLFEVVTFMCVHLPIIYIIDIETLFLSDLNALPRRTQI